MPVGIEEVCFNSVNRWIMKVFGARLFMPGGIKI